MSPARRPARKAAPSGQAWADVLRLGLALALPGVEEGTSYGTPALKVKGKLLLRLKEDGETLAVRLSFDDRDALLQLHPDVFYLTDHYRPYEAVLLRLPAVAPELLGRVLEQSWRKVAPSKLVAARTR